MSLPADYHMHTPLCRHATGEPTELAAQAVRIGLKEIGFSEHNPMIRDDWDDWHMLQGDLDQYVEKVCQARRDHPQLTIKLAMEVDFIPGQEDWIRHLAAITPFEMDDDAGDDRVTRQTSTVAAREICQLGPAGRPACLCHLLPQPARE